MSNLSIRVLTAAIGIPIVFAVNYLGDWLFAVVTAIVALIAAWEFRTMMLPAAYPVSPLLLIACPVMAALPYFVHSPQSAWIGLLVALLVTGGMVNLAPSTTTNAFLGWALTLLGTVYIGLLLGHLELLRQLHRGAWWIATLFVITWSYDTGAYFTGRFLGSHPFMHHISPKKTVEGVVGGLVLAAGSGLLATLSLGLPVWQSLGLGLCLGTVAQVGDLCQSLMKRHVGLKDSGNVVPGHGGLLDRIDSLLFTGVCAYYGAVVLGYGP